MNPFGIAAGLIFLGLMLRSSGIFDGANSFAVVIFVGMMFGVPAALFFVLGLLATTAKPPSAPDPRSKKYLHKGDIPGACPNCDATIALDSLACPHCCADFGDYSAWRVRKRGHGTGKRHA